MGVIFITGLVLIFILGSVVWILFGGVKKPFRATSDLVQRRLDRNLEWLERRWVLADEDFQSGNHDRFKRWYFDSSTDTQVQALEERGFIVDSETLTKGMASDLLGLFFEVDESDKEILKFFKVSLRGSNQTKARHDVAEIMGARENIEKWISRPAQPIQKEFYRYFQLRVPKGLTYAQAEEEIRSLENEFYEREYLRLKDWEAYSCLYDEIIDIDTRDIYGLKKPSLSLFREAVSSFENQGVSITALLNDLDTFIDRLLSLKPELRKHAY